MNKIKYNHYQLDPATEEIILCDKEGVEVDRIDINSLLTEFLRNSEMYEED